MDKYFSDSDSASLQSVSSAENAQNLEGVSNENENVHHAAAGALFSETSSSAVLQTMSQEQAEPFPDEEHCQRSDWLTLWNTLGAAMPPSPTQKRYTDLESMVNKSNRCLFRTARQIISSVLACIVCAVEQTANTPISQRFTNENYDMLEIHSRNNTCNNAWRDSTLWCALAARLCRSTPTTFEQYAPLVLQQLYALSQSHRLWSTYTRSSPITEPPDTVKFVLSAIVDSVCKEASQSAVLSTGIPSTNARPKPDTRKPRVRLSTSKPAVTHVSRVTDLRQMVSGGAENVASSVSAAASVSASIAVASGASVTAPLWSAYMTHLQPKVTFAHAAPRAVANLVLSAILQCVCHSAETERSEGNSKTQLKPLSQKPLSRGVVTVGNRNPTTSIVLQNINVPAAATNTTPAAQASAVNSSPTNAVYTTYHTILRHVRFAYENNTTVSWTDVDKEMQRANGTALHEWVAGILPLAKTPRQTYTFLMDVQNHAAPRSRRQKCVLALNCIVDAVDVCEMCTTICTRGCLAKDFTGGRASASVSAAVSQHKGGYNSAEDALIRQAVRTWEQFGLVPNWAGVDRALGRSPTSAQHRWKHRLAPGTVPQGAPVLHAASSQPSPTTPMIIYRFTEEEDALLVQHLNHLPQPVAATVWGKLSALLNRPQYALRNRWHRLQKTMIRQSFVSETELWACYVARGAKKCAESGAGTGSADRAHAEVKQVLDAVISTVVEVMHAVLERQRFVSPSEPKQTGFRAEKRKHFSLAEDLEIIKCARQRLHRSTLQGHQQEEQDRSAVITSESAVLTSHLQRWADLGRCLGRSHEACRQRLCRLSLMKRYTLLLEVTDSSKREESAELCSIEIGVLRTAGAVAKVPEEVHEVLCAVVDVLELVELYPLHAMHFK